MLPKYDEIVRSTTCERERGERIDLTVVDRADMFRRLIVLSD